jgi:hypothetical protein
MQKYIIIGFIALAIVFGWFIFKMAKDDKTALINNKELHGIITDKYISIKGKPHFQDIKVDDSIIFPLTKEMIPDVAIGDSIFKNKGEDFIILKKDGSGKILRFDI